MRTAIFACGNPERGDDALGLLLFEQAEAWKAGQPTDGAAADLGLVADYQLQIEHASDLQEKDLVLFLDADASCLPPYSFRPIQAAADASYTTHELSPEAVLHVYEQITRLPAPASFVLSVRGEQFELGHPLSEQATVHLRSARELLTKLLDDPSPAAWTLLAEQHQARSL